MAAITLADGVESLDIDDFSRFVARELPGYAQPVFLRIQRNMDLTGTFKLVKGELKEQGYDIHRIDEQLYVLKPRATAYEPLERAFYAEIRAGTAGY
jgi:citronellyl-CoA synthetase